MSFPKSSSSSGDTRLWSFGYFVKISWFPFSFLFDTFFSPIIYFKGNIAFCTCFRCSLLTWVFVLVNPFPPFETICFWNFKPPRLCGSQPPLPPALGCFSGIFTSSCVSPWLLKAIHSLSKVTSFYDTISRAFSDFLVPESRFTNSATHCFRSSRLLFSFVSFQDFCQTFIQLCFKLRQLLQWDLQALAPCYNISLCSPHVILVSPQSLQLSLPIVALVFHDSKMPLSLTHLSSRQRSTAPHQLLQTMLVFTSFWIHPRFVDASVVLLELPWACGSANLSVVLIPWNQFEEILFNSIHQSRSKLADLLKKWFYKTWEKNFVNYHRLFSEKDPQNLNTPKTFIFSLLWVHQLELAVAGFSSVVPPPSSSAFVTPLKRNVNKTRAKRPCTNLHCFET